MSKDICVEMTVEIFSRLPTKSLLRFRAVSKSLCDLIGSPGFIRFHALRSPKKFVCLHHIPYKDEEKHKSKKMYTFHCEGQLAYNSYTGITAIDYPFPGSRIFGSCNGILCVYALGKGVVLWNPSTRCKVTICDPRVSFSHTIVYGFGFDPVIHDYKIVRISKPTSFVYTIKTRSWRKIASRATPFHRITSEYQLLFNGVMHRVAVSYDVSIYKDCYYIMTFDFSSEVFSSIELPEPTWKTSGLAIIKGCLAVISATRNDCRIWVRREYKNTAAFWSVAYKVNTFSYSDQVDRFFQLSANDNLLLDIYAMGIKVYNPETQVRSQLADLSGSSHIVSMYVCAESLELLDLGTSCYPGKQIPGKW